MIKESRVRRRPRTGLGANKRVNQGVVYLDGQWISRNVIVMGLSDFRGMVNEISRYKRQFNNAVKMLKG